MIACPASWNVTVLGTEQFGSKLQARKGRRIMTTIKIPASVEDATQRLGAIERLLTAQGWERAAIVAAFVRLDNRPGPQSSTTSSRTPGEFAALGIAGMKSKDTVRTYVQNWLDANDGKYPKPGAKAVMPLADYPANASKSTNTPTKVIASIVNDPSKVANLVAEATAVLGPEAVAEAVSKTAEAANAVEAQAAAERVKKNYSERSRGIVNDLDDLAARSREAFNKASTGQVGSAADVVNIRRLLAELRLWNPNGAPGLIEEVYALNDFVQGWLTELTADRAAVWTDADRLLASELGIELEVSR